MNNAQGISLILIVLNALMFILNLIGHAINNKEAKFLEKVRADVLESIEEDEEYIKTAQEVLENATKREEEADKLLANCRKYLDEAKLYYQRADEMHRVQDDEQINDEF